MYFLFTRIQNFFFFSDSDRCPVKSFVKYIRRLNPNCNKFFQQPRSTPADGIFYNNIALGHNKLGTYMTEISRFANLSREYTNHSCRATTVHLLDEAQFASRHIMSVTGHRSEASLKTYSGKTCETTKKMMSKTLTEKTLRKSHMSQENRISISEKSRSPISTISPTFTTNIDFLALSQSSVTIENEETGEHVMSKNSFELQALSSSQTENVLNDLIPDNDGFDEFVKDLEIPNNSVSKEVATNPVNPFPMPLNISNCQNITINYNVYPNSTSRN